jgi:hypothetical protein
VFAPFDLRPQTQTLTIALKPCLISLQLCRRNERKAYGWFSPMSHL